MDSNELESLCAANLLGYEGVLISRSVSVSGPNVHEGSLWPSLVFLFVYLFVFIPFYMWDVKEGA